MSEELKVYEEKMEKSIDALLNEYASIRAGRANPHVLDKIKVDYYGTPTPIQQVGNISVPEARMILIQPWEKSLIRPIEKAIQTSELGINPSNDGSVIRLVFPELTEERRKELAKDVKKKGDGAKVAIRNIRRDANEAFKKMEKNDEISEDDLKELPRKSRSLPTSPSRRSTRPLRTRQRKFLPFNRSFLLHKTDRGQGKFSCPRLFARATSQGPCLHEVLTLLSASGACPATTGTECRRRGNLRNTYVSHSLRGQRAKR